MSGRRHVEPIRAPIGAVVARAAAHEDGAVSPRELGAERVPIGIEEAAQQNFDPSRPKPGDDRLDRSSDRTGIAAPLHVVVAPWTMVTCVPAGT